MTENSAVSVRAERRFPARLGCDEMSGSAARQHVSTYCAICDVNEEPLLHLTALLYVRAREAGARAGMVRTQVSSPYAGSGTTPRSGCSGVQDP